MARLPAQAGVRRVLHGAQGVRSLTVVPQPA
jgi:hypothetical protein